jgi:hypothetical protein
MFCAAQDLPLPEGWTATTFPASTSGMSDELLCANHSSSEWHVTVKPGAVQVSHTSDEKHPKLPPHFNLRIPAEGRIVVAKAGTGWLIGNDAGEFGGGLWWTNNDGRENKRLSGENVHVILTRQNELLVFTGLAHMGSDEGKVYAYRPAVQSAGDLVELADLGSAPNAALIDNNETVLIAAQTRIIALDPSNHVRVLYQNSDMGLLYTDSIAEDPAGNVLVGMRFFVLRLRPSQDGEFTREWYVPDRCTKTKVVGFHCECTAQKE